jgi:hypothetical protein
MTGRIDHSSSVTRRWSGKAPQKCGARFDLRPVVAPSRIGALCIALGILFVAACEQKQEPHKGGTDPQAKDSRRDLRLGNQQVRREFVTVEQVMSRLRRDPSGLGIDQESVEFLKQLAVDHPDLALQAYLRDPGAMNFQGFPEVANALCQHHPEFIAEWLGGDLEKEVADRDFREGFVLMLIAELAGANATMALDAWEKLSNNSYPDDRVTSAVFTRMGVSDMRGAIAEAKSRLGGKRLNEAIISIATGGAMRDVEGALGILEMLPSKKEKNEAIAMVVGQIGYRDYDKIASTIESMDGKAIGEILLSDRTGAFKAAILKNDLTAVKRALDATVLTDHSSPLFFEYVSNKMGSDPESTLDYINELPESPRRDTLLGSAFSTWSLTDFDGALGKALELQGTSKDEAMKRIASSAGTKGMEFVLSAAEKIDRSQMESFIVGAIGPACNTDLDGALDYVNSGKYLTDAVSEQSKSKVVQAVTGYYAAKNPDEALKWLTSLEGGVRVDAMQAYARQRAQADIMGLSEQLADMPRDDAWRSGVKVLVSELRNSDPVRAKEWEEALQQK